MIRRRPRPDPPPAETREHGSSRAAGRSHHIASVAHHFLADTETAAPFVFVAGPAAHATLAREVARAWARGRGGAVGYVDGGADAVRTGVAAEDDALRLRKPDEAPDDGERAVVWRLGALDRRRLDDLEAVGRVPGGRLPGAGHRRVLVWCAEPESAPRWRSLVDLGRLASVLGPVGIALLVDRERIPAATAALHGRRGGAAVDRAVEVVPLPSAERPGARAAALATLPGLLDPAGA